MTPSSPALLVIVATFAFLSPQVRTDVVRVACTCAADDKACIITYCSGLGSGPGTGNVGTSTKSTTDQVIQPKKPSNEAPRPSDRLSPRGNP
jgi:hypothetical protein